MSEKEKDPNWMQNLWRPMMGWMYMLVCMCDMIVFPVLWAFWQGYNHVPITQWDPLSLKGAGLFHIAMGAVLGISAFGRTQEKLAGTAANPTATQTITTTNGSGVPASGGFGGMNNGNTGGFGGSPAFGAAPTGGFGSSPSGFGSPAASTGFGGGGFGGAPSPAPAGSGFGGGFNAAPQPVTTTASGKKIVPSDPDPEL